MFNSIGAILYQAWPGPKYPSRCSTECLLSGTGETAGYLRSIELNMTCNCCGFFKDQIPPFRTSTALKVIESELGSPARKLFANISEEPVAAASLGQVYKASLVSGERVAVKVQRPGMQARLVLDSYLLHIIGGPLQRYLGARGDILDAVNEMVHHMFDEINYIKEGQNAERFAVLYGGLTRGYSEPTSLDNKASDTRERWRARTELKFDEGRDLVKVPKIYWNLSSKGVLTMEWIDGIKLTNLQGLHKMNFDIQKLVDQGVFSSLRQLLEEGFFHADPHPGNLVVTKEGMLAYFDFGMMGDFPRADRIGLIRTLVHFVNRDSLGLANDFSILGFVPKGADLDEIAVELRASFGDESSKAQLDFQGIMSQLSNVMYKYNFRLPPQYALVIRALGSLEGTATLLDPDFKVVASAYPFIIGRLLADPDPDMRKILRELLIRNNGSIRWHRLERLVIAIAEQSSTSGSSKDLDREKLWSEQDGLNKNRTGSRDVFDTRTVVSATSDLLEYIMSEEGYRVRVLLIQDIVKAFDAFLDEALWTYVDSHAPARSGYEELKLKHGNQDMNGRQTTSGRKINSDGGPGSSEGAKDFSSRISIAANAFKRAVNSSPELWITMLFSFATRSETQVFIWNIIYSLIKCGKLKGSEGIWLLLSRMLHDVYDTSKAGWP
ncbi:hypothetical protein GOP47_0024207 [Adiantum capillus-veneris]|uniref:Protein kinase domain-containing protein n=1 Tax=Adiantum capillus-veneris TaxID=13818 RepID=A0A9D4Z5W6_ADICA|nr:hypothetical protein GOP47_0024207 [Adiantum capillus-veneris]